MYEIDRLKDEYGQDEEFAKEYKTLMKTPVYVDSPLAISATEIFQKNLDLLEEEIQEKIKSGDNPLDFPGLKFTRTADESKQLNEMNEPCIILSASGMCDVGRIKHHLKHNLWNPKSTILFVGYQAPGTLGRAIVEGAKKVKIFGEEIAVNARIEYIEGYSGHADQEWLLNFVYSFINKPKHIFLVHGEIEGQEVLKQKIEETTNIPVTIPSFGESYELEEVPQLLEREEKFVNYDHIFARMDILNQINELNDQIETVEETIKADINTNDLDIENLSIRIMEIQKQIKSLIVK